MVMRHKPIRPKLARQMPQQGKQRVPLSVDQNAALQKWVRDFKVAAPEMVRVAAIEQRLFQEMLDASTWQIAETERPEHITEEPKPWTVGHAKVNYVDKIDGVDEEELK